MKRQKVRIERSLLLPVEAERVPSLGYCGMRFRLKQRFTVSTSAHYEPQRIADVYATAEQRINADWTLVRIPLATEGW